MLKFTSNLILPFCRRPCILSKNSIGFSNIRSPCLQNLVSTYGLSNAPIPSCDKCVLRNIYSAKAFFHTSPKRHALPPILVILIRPITKFLAIAFGRSIRVWWKRLSPNQREYYMKALKKKKLLYVALFTPVPLGALYFYVNHIEETPITKRRRFIAFSKEQMVELADIEQKVITDEFAKAILPATHPAYCRVLRVVSRLLDCNRDVEGINEHPWRIIVIEERNTVNAFVLANGTIFIYTGILELCTNDNQLSIVLAHEMSHTLLHHTAERLSNAQLIECLLFIPIVIIWAILPDLGAMLTQWLSGLLTKTFLHLPFSRQTEMEADDVGLTLAAKACFDVREALCFWKKMKAMTEDCFEELEWLSTHPSYDTRLIVLEDLIPSALKMRESCQCPKLPSQDPRLSIDGIIKMMTENKMVIKQVQSKA